MAKVEYLVAPLPSLIYKHIVSFIKIIMYCHVYLYKLEVEGINKY